MDVRAYNKVAWDKLVDSRDRWTVPVSPEEIARARRGDFSVLLTPKKAVPREWFPAQMKGSKVLCLASGGGQQSPIFAAAGADVTVLDNSPKQLARDQEVAAREGLSIQTVEGDMPDLGAFRSDTFDWIFHPCSNCFAEEILSVWRESFRVLKKHGFMLSGFSNPIINLFDPDLEKQGTFQLKFTMPHSDLDLTEEERHKWYPDEPINFAHSLEDQLGGQTAAGFLIADLYEDDWGGNMPIDKFFKGFIATRSIKP